MNISSKVRRLSKNEKEQFIESGYIKNLPVFSKIGVKNLEKLFNQLKSRLPKNININKTNMWHKASKSFYELCRTPPILDYVEDILGKNFYQWGGTFFYKEPKSQAIVPWHQDAQYWPLAPSESVTVWLSVYDTDKDNSAMRVVTGSHKQNKYFHSVVKKNNYLLDQEVSYDQIDENEITYIDLKAGEISLHTDALLHGSGANYSNRPRCGIVMRFSPTKVKADLSIWPFFSIQVARGVDTFKYNPVAPIPKGEATPTKQHQFAHEFEKYWK